MQSISHHGQPDGGQVKPDLVGSPCSNTHLKQAHAVVAVPVVDDAVGGLAIGAQSRKPFMPLPTKSDGSMDMHGRGHACPCSHRISSAGA